MHAEQIITHRRSELEVIPGRRSALAAKLDPLGLALTGGAYLAICAALVTIASLFGMPGFPPFTQLLAEFYGPYGYSVTWAGVIVGAFWGFVEGFVHFGLFALLYNRVRSIHR